MSVHQQQKQQSTGSPFVDPSPSTPIVPSPLPGDSEKLASAAVSHQSAVQTTHQLAASGPPQTQAISVGTPGISASPLLAEFTSQDGNLPNSTIMPRTSASERPVERLIKTVQSLSPKSFSSVVSDISSVVSMIDRIACPAPGNCSRAAVGEDLVAMTRWCLQGRYSLSQDGGAAVKKMKRHASAMPLNNVSSAGSINEIEFISFDSSEIESMETSRVKRQKLEPPIAPLRLLVPADYPNSSPLPLDKLPLEPGMEIEDLSFKARSRFSILIHCLSQPISLGEMARKWNECARKVIVEYAQQMGGGTFSSKYGVWENCVGA